jgi:hypothetical protein
MTLQVPEEHFLKASEALAFRALWNPASRLDFENFTKNNILKTQLIVSSLQASSSLV